MRVAVDCMGGDLGPAPLVLGAAEAASALRCSVILVGDEDQIRDELEGADYPRDRVAIQHASEVVAMDDSPTAAVRRKRDSSMLKAVEAVREGRADGCISAGNTGAFMATAKLLLGSIKGIERPAIATLLPSSGQDVVLLDAGANVDCKPRHLCQFAIMGDAFARRVLGIAEPRVGLLGIGAEDSKGNELTRRVHQTLSAAELNYVGNVEGRDIFNGSVDVVVCDGFIGNIVLKSAEGLAVAVADFLRESLMASLPRRLGARLARGAFTEYKRKLDYAERGGAPLLGTTGVCVVCHGSSSAKAVRNAVGEAAQMLDKGVNARIADRVAAIAGAGGGLLRHHGAQETDSQG